MAEPTKRGWWLDKVLVPIIGSVVGAIAATWFQASALDQAQLADVVELLKDPAMDATQKVKALEIYQNITDRPWSLMRSLITSLTIFMPMFLMALLYRGYFDRSDR